MLHDRRLGNMMLHDRRLVIPFPFNFPLRFGNLNSIGRRGKKTRNRPVIPAVDPRGKTEKQNHSYRSPIDGDRRFPPSILPDLSRGRRSIADNFFIILGHTASPRRGCHHSLLTKCGTKKSLRFPFKNRNRFLQEL